MARNCGKISFFCGKSGKFPDFMVLVQSLFAIFALKKQKRLFRDL